MVWIMEYYKKYLITNVIKPIYYADIRDYKRDITGSFCFYKYSMVI